jgi:hypothetical protein
MVLDQHQDEKQLETLLDHDEASHSPIQDAIPATLPPARYSSDTITAQAPTQLEPHSTAQETYSSASPDDADAPFESVNVSRVLSLAELC